MSGDTTDASKASELLNGSTRFPYTSVMAFSVMDKNVVERFTARLVSCFRALRSLRLIVRVTTTPLGLLGPLEALRL